jgi:DNA polymerase/3'-5' exonuclease PolX
MIIKMKQIKNYKDFCAVTEAILIPGTAKIKRAVAINIAKTIIEGLGFKFINPDSVTTSYSYEPNVGIPVGSIRRKKEEVGDIDLIITAPIDMENLAAQSWAKRVTGGEKQINFVFESGTIQRKVNIYSFTDAKSFGGALLHTTGSAQYNIRLRNVVRNRGFGKLNQYGLFDTKGNFVAGPTEASILKTMAVTVREANQRER